MCAQEFFLWTKKDCEGTSYERGTRTWFYFGVSGHAPVGRHTPAMQPDARPYTTYNHAKCTLQRTARENCQSGDSAVGWLLAQQLGPAPAA